MKMHIRSTIATTAGVALASVGCAGAAQAAQAAGPYACQGQNSSCKVVSQADIDGDGQRDSVGMTTWGRSADSEKITIRVATAAGERMHTVTTGSFRDDSRYRGAAKIDGEDGAEIVLRTDLGAHTARHRVITYRDGALTTLRDPDHQSRWMTDSSAWSGFGYKRTTTSNGAMRMVRYAAVDDDRDGTFDQTVLTSRWKNGEWQQTRKVSRAVDARTARTYVGWHVPHLAKGL